MDEREFVTPVGNRGMYVLDTASWRVYRPVIDKTKCTNCGICLSYCPVNSPRYSEGQGYYIDYTYCKGCGICAVECPRKAISMIKEEK